jgi:hypothetical protein
LPPGVASPAVSKRRRERSAEVVDLSEIRAQLRLVAYQEKIARVLESNRRAIGRLYATDALFTHQGARAGRDLLLAHQHLLKVVGLLNRLSNAGDVPAPRQTKEVDEVYKELDALLDRTNELTNKTGHFLARLRGE